PRLRRSRPTAQRPSLTLLSDKAYYDFAQGLARRVLRAAPATGASERLTLVFRLCLARSPQPGEVSRIKTLLSQQMESFQRSPADALRVTGADIPAEIDVAQWAAWTSAARALLNLDEFVTRE